MGMLWEIIDGMRQGREPLSIVSQYTTPEGLQKLSEELELLRKQYLLKPLPGSDSESSNGSDLVR